MDLRVYVDGVARIICDLTPRTTVHDIIIALAQYKGKAGRYSLVERAPDGTQRTVSPQELTSQLIHHPRWSYILRENPQTRSKSLDGRKTPVEPISVPSSHSRTVHRAHTKRPSRSALPRQTNEQQYSILFDLLRTQEKQVEEQQLQLNAKDQEIQYREALIQQHQRNQEEYQRLEEHHRRLTLECQYYTEEYSPEKLQEEYDCHQQCHSDYEHLQQQLARCLASLEQNQQVSQQIQSNIDQIETEIDLIQTTLKNEKKEMLQYEEELEQANLRAKKQYEEFEHFTQEQEQSLQSAIEQRQKKLRFLEEQLENLHTPSYYFPTNPSSTADLLINRALWKLCPSGIWV